MLLGIYFNRSHFDERFCRNLSEWWSAAGYSLPCRAVDQIISGVTRNRGVMSDMTWHDVGGYYTVWCSFHSTPVYGPALSQWSSSSAALVTSLTHYTLSQWSSISAALITSLTHYTLVKQQCGFDYVPNPLHVVTMVKQQCGFGYVPNPLHVVTMVKQQCGIDYVPNPLHVVTMVKQRP